MRRLTTLFVCMVMFVVSARAEDAEEFLDAARSGDLARLAKLIDEGADVDSTGPYGNTALIAAATQGHDALVRLLIERGADVNHEESFYGASAVDMALFNGHPETARLLLESGAEDREAVFMSAIRSADPDLGRAAIESGPLLESTLETLRSMPMLGAAFKGLLTEVESRPDPAPPEYGPEDLARYVGSYEGWNSTAETVVSLRQGGLVMALSGDETIGLESSGEDAFRSTEGGLRVQFSGRAGTIEGISVGSGGATPQYMRRSVARVVEGAAARVRASNQPRREGTANWPAFRGVNADGIGDGVDTPIDWDLESGRGVLWQIDLPGLGNSSPIVWGDRSRHHRGRRRSEQSIRTGSDRSRQRGRGDGPSTAGSSWPSTSRAASSSGDRGGAGRTADQASLQGDAGQFDPATDGATSWRSSPPPVWPASTWTADPLAARAGRPQRRRLSRPGHRVGFRQLADISTARRVILQVDVHDGAVSGGLGPGHRASRCGAPIAGGGAVVGHAALLAGPTGRRAGRQRLDIHGYDPATGRELWSLGPNSELVIATPVVGDGVVYVSAGYPPIKPIYALRAGTRGAVEAEPGEEHERLAWSHSPGGAYMPTPLLYRGVFYVVHHNGRIVAYDAARGDAVYKRRFSKGGVFTGSPVAVNGKLYLPTEDGLMYVLAAGPEYEELVIHDFGEALMASPAVADGVLLVRTPSRLIALGREDSAAGS